jgi:hypothetical protein
LKIDNITKIMTPHMITISNLDCKSIFQDLSIFQFTLENVFFSKISSHHAGFSSANERRLKTRKIFSLVHFSTSWNTMRHILFHIFSSRIAYNNNIIVIVQKKLIKNSFVIHKCETRKCIYCMFNLNLRQMFETVF